MATARKVSGSHTVAKATDTTKAVVDKRHSYVPGLDKGASASKKALLTALGALFDVWSEVLENGRFSADFSTGPVTIDYTGKFFSPLVDMKEKGAAAVLVDIIERGIDIKFGNLIGNKLKKLHKSKEALDADTSDEASFEGLD